MVGRFLLAMVPAVLLGAGGAGAQSGDLAWMTSWVGPVQGPYPVGNPSAQPDQRFAFPDVKVGARDQTLRLIVRPSVWGREARLRLSNAFGTRPVTYGAVHVGLQLGAASLVPGTNRPVLFAGRPSVTVAPGESAWSDAVALPFVDDSAPERLAGRKLAVSLHVAGESGPMTWHAKALQTSYATAPGAGGHGADEGEDAYPYVTASWFFLDALDMRMPSTTRVVVGFGDSITDGTASTMNGDDRWPDVLARRLERARGLNRVAVLNSGIGGNQVVGPSEYGPETPFPGGPSALQRLNRDLLDLSGVTTVIWLEGINDFSRNGDASLESVIAGYRDGVRALKAKGIRVLGATLTTALGSTSAAHGFPEQDEKRKALNAFIRTSGVFDGVVEFDPVTLDAPSGGLKPAMVPESTSGGAGDKLHPNRTGYHAMGFAIGLDQIVPPRP